MMTINQKTGAFARFAQYLGPSGSTLGVRDEPLQSDVNIVFFFAGDGIAADFSVLNGIEVHFFYQTILIQSLRQVAFIAEDQDRNPGQLGLF